MDESGGVGRVATPSRRKISVDVLSALFGLSSWLAMTGLWAEMPLLVQRLPEGWALASQLALYLQLANVGPVAYGVARARYRGAADLERLATHAQLGVGVAACVLLVFLWGRTPWGRSVPLFALSFGLSLVDCTSSVVFLPYMARFRSCYLTSYLVGEGLSGLLPGLLAAAQGVRESGCPGEEAGGARFPPEWFFAFLGLLVLLSWAGFAMLDRLPHCRSERVRPERDIEMASLPGGEARASPPTRGALYYFLLFLQGWASVATFGIFPALQPYSCLPYGPDALHAAVVLCGLAYPAACSVALFREWRSARAVGALSVLATALSLYPLATAALSPQPPLRRHPAGAPLVVSCWVCFVAVFSYVKTVATLMLGGRWGPDALFWCGAVTQGGAVAGALLMFLLVNVFRLFRDDGLCP